MSKSSAAPSPSSSGMDDGLSDDALLASYNINLDDHFTMESDPEGEDGRRSDSPLSLPSSMLDSDDEGYTAALASAKSGTTHTTTYGRNFNGASTTTSLGGTIVPESFTIQLSRLEKDLSRLAHEKELLTGDLVRERKKHREDVTSLRRRNRSDFGQVRSKQAELEAEVPLLRARLEHTKETLRSLEISSALYVELDRIPETQLSIREFVLVQVHRLIKKEREEAERSRRETETLRTTLSREKVDHDRAIMELQHRLATAENQKELVTDEGKNLLEVVTHHTTPHHTTQMCWSVWCFFWCFGFLLG